MAKLLFGLIVSLLIYQGTSLAGSSMTSLEIGPKDRPATIKVPKAYQDSSSWPLILALHGRGSTAELTDFYLGISRQQDRLGYLTILAQGKTRSDGQTFWNATPECCDADNTGIDDSTYLQNLVLEAMERFSIDPDRIYIIGHSNGGFMAYRLACDTDGLFRGIVSIAGSTFGDESLCQTQTPINILQIHGTEDQLVDYYGQNTDFPGAQETIERWADRNNCAHVEENPRSKNLLFFKFEPGLSPEGRPTIIGGFKDFISFSFKKETDEILWDSCDDGVRVGLWSINGSDHGPLFWGRDLVKQSLDFLDGR